MKKIVLASAAMGGAALVAFGAAGTFAAFTDSAASDPSSATAGSLFLVPADNQTSTAQGVSVDNLAPGQEATYVFYVANGGTLPGKLTGTFQLTSDAENTCLEIEGEAGDESCPDADDNGELGGATAVKGTYGAVASAAQCTATSTFPAAFGYDANYTLESLDGESGIAATVPGTQGFCAVVTIKVDPTGVAGNTIQTDTASFQIDYRLDQIPA